MKYIVKQYLKYKIRKATIKMNNEDNDIVKRAYKNMIDSFESSLLFISVF